MIIYYSQQYGRRGQRIDSSSREDKVRKRDRDINNIYMEEVKLVALFLRKRWFPLVLSRCGFQGKLKLLVLVSLFLLILVYFVRTH